MSKEDPKAWLARMEAMSKEASEEAGIGGRGWCAFGYERFGVVWGFDWRGVDGGNQGGRGW